jgi:hypothetical protein
MKKTIGSTKKEGKKSSVTTWRSSSTVKYSYYKIDIQNEAHDKSLIGIVFTRTRYGYNMLGIFHLKIPGPYRNA